MMDRDEKIEREEIPFDDVYEIVDWSRREKPRPPKTLFGDLWLEGEVAVMFADTGMGKSTLAVEIAEGVARGRALGLRACGGSKFSPPCEVTAAAQKVLLIDLESTRAQLRRRYAKYAFSDNLVHVRIDRERLLAKGRDAIEETIKRLTNIHKAKVVVIDSLSYLKRRIDSTNEAADIMLTLKRMSRERELSILIVGRSKGLIRHRSLRIGDLHTGRAIADIADSIFAVGRSLDDHRLLYLKHLKSRSTDVIFTASHLPAYRIERARSGFLGFAFARYTNEREMLVDAGSAFNRDWELIRQIRGLCDRGMDIRTIAADLGLARSTVHRLLHISRDEAFMETIRPKCRFCGALLQIDGTHEQTAQQQQIPLPEPKPWVDPDAFPGEDIFRAVSRLAWEIKDKYEYDGPVEWHLRCGSYSIGETAVREARKIWKETGKAPTLLEIMEDEHYKDFDQKLVFDTLGIGIEQLRHASETARSQPAGTPILPLTKWQILDFPGVEEYNEPQQKIADALVEVHLLDTAAQDLLTKASLRLQEAKKKTRQTYAQTASAPTLSHTLTNDPFAEVDWQRVWKLVGAKPSYL